MNEILLVDDDPYQLRLLSRQLATLGHEKVSCCDTPSSALAVLDAPDAAIGLLFLDLNMPQMDGVEVMRALAGRGYAGALVLISGEDSRILETAMRLAFAHELNVLGALPKPCENASLAALLDRWQRFHRPARQAAGKTYAPDEVRHAIEHGELVNHYQPKVELATGAPVGVETLVRWRHPQDGLVYPDRFIGVAEEHDFIDALTRRVIRDALDQTKAWRDMGLRLSVAVNVSMDDLVALDFPDFVLDELGRTGVPAGDLILEVTESRLMKDPRAPMEILTRLRLKRVRLSIDDFGTGHSSLAQLRDLPFVELKVDRGFVHGGATNPTMGAILTASRTMAQQLGMKTVAEGVEDLGDWHWLRDYGCDLAQGYFIGKPMPAEELPGWLTAWEGRRAGLACDRSLREG